MSGVGDDYINEALKKMSDDLLMSYGAYPTTRKESDDELRARLRYVTGEGQSADGAALEALAARYGLKRREHAWTVVGVDPGFERSYLGSWKDLI
jgi:hypothetical protein